MSQAYIIDQPNKFDTCRHRSEQEISKTIKRCSCQGGNYETKGFFCYKKNIFKVNHNFCATCDQYEAK